MKTKGIKLLSALVAVASILGASLSARALDCCIQISAPSNTATINITSPFLVTGDTNAADNVATFIEQVIVGNPSVAPGNYPGWCVDIVDDIDKGPKVYSTVMHSSCDTNLNSELAAGYPANVYVSPDTWHLINYILNHKGSNYFWNIQEALWYFIGGPPLVLGPPYPPTDLTAVQAIIDDAQANGPAWQMQCGDIEAVVVEIQATPLEQLTIIEVPTKPTCKVTFTKIPASTNLGCNPPSIPDCTGVINSNLVSATSTCGPVTITCSKLDSMVNCQNVRVITYVATDGQGGAATNSYSITWTVDLAGPTITHCAPDITVTPDQGVPAPNTNLVSVTDSCSAVLVTWGGDVTNGVCPQIISRTYIATDACGKTATCIQTITVAPNGQIGDYVWLDTDGDGCQDSGETGMANVQVDLYVGCGLNGSPIATTNTDSTGHYLFSDLCLGTYTVNIHTPAGYKHTVANAGCTNPSLPPNQNQLDSKCTCDDSAPCGICVTLTAGNSTNLNVDCGFIPSLTVNCAASTGQVGLPYDSFVTASGGCTPYTFSIISGTLPPGLTLNTGTGEISGTPTTGGTYPYVVQVTDNCGNTADTSSENCGITIMAPSLVLIKTATPTNAQVGQPVTYSYLVSNTGPVLITNINITDDNGTPGDTSDDYFVNSAPFSLAPGASKQFSISHITEPTCMTNNGTNLFVGNLTVNVLTNGDVEVFFNQSQGLNDNRYGTGANATTGWAKGHTFSDLVGSDEATFLFTDGTGKAVLEFACDYISQATSAKFGNGVTITYPSGYGTLGPNGGDGKMIIGAASNVLSASTTFSDSLNKPGFTTAYKTNSPTETFPLSGISTPPGWNYVDGYHVIVSHLAFGSNGFGGVSVPLVHNSPSKGPVDQATATNSCSCVVNTATVYATQGTNIVASDTDTAMVCFGNQTTTNGNCNCTPHDIKYNFNGTQIIFQPTGGGSYVWFISDGVVTGLPPGKAVTIHIYDQVITIPATASSPTYTIPAPDSYVTYDPAVTVATATFDTASNVWRITLPTTPMAGNVFYGGAAFPVPAAGLPGGIKNVDWSGTFSTDTTGINMKWQWHAAAYTSFTSDYNAIAPKPVDDNKASVYKTSDLAGTPEGTNSATGKTWKTYVTGGASGGGGANYTGSGSSTIQFAPCVCNPGGLPAAAPKPGPPPPPGH